MKIYKNRITYIRKFCNILIDILFTTILITIVIAIYKFICIILLNIPDLNTIYGSLISVSVTIILAFISYIAKLKKHLPVLLSKIKQRIYQILSWKYNPFLSLVITDFNRNNLSESEEQSKIVNSAICILKNNTQNMILISGLPGRGKTTSLMFLLDAIAHDKELYEIFSKLQNSIAYFDGVNDKNILMSYLGHNNNQKFKLIIIDNIQKYTILSINEIMDRINNLTSHNQNMSEKVLLILLYQKTDRNEALYEYIKNKFFKEDNIFQLNRYVILESNSSQKSCFGHEEELRTRIQKIDDPLFRQHMKYILYNRRDNSIIILLNDLLFAQPTKIVSHKEKIFYVLIAAIIMGLYNGYITKKELHFLWRKKYSFFSLPLEEILIKYYVRNRVLTPFPFIHSSYIFNEQLAKEYRKRLIHNDYYQKQSSLIAETMFLHCEEEMPQKWLFFLLCSSNFCKDFPQYKRIHYFENALSTYHLQYILDLVETEISILSEKEKIFRQELGIIYIYNGDWSKAKKILYPYVQSHDINKDIWHIQLRIIEAEHGGIDDEYLEMLEYIETECTDPVILFQVRYWREHIRMEHGNFCLDTWNELVQEIISADELDCLRRNEHFSIRIISDYERTYFLKGNIHYPRYRNIISEYRHLNNKNDKNFDPIEFVLSRAYYIQYDILYQLGIWGYSNCGVIDPDIICNAEPTDNNNVMDMLLKEALNRYDFCIHKYQSEGKKKYRTLAVRRAELTLCIDTNHFFEVLNQYEKFEHYANQNNITVFEGYCHTQKGKAFALYADYMFRKNDYGRFKEYLNKSEDHLLQAQQIYEKWGNVYGMFRAELLIILIHMIQDRNIEKSGIISPDTYRNKYCSLLSNLTKKHNSDQQFVREHNIIEYLQKNIIRIDLPLRVLKFYPIILQ